MAKLEVKTKENPKLQQSTLSDGRISLYLEYYLGRTQWVDEETGKTKVKHDRKKESLNLYLIAKPRNPIERQTNKETLELAMEIRAEREQELKKDRTGKRLFKTKNTNFLDAFQIYIDSYTKKDVRMMQIALNRFKDFLKQEHSIYSKNIKPEQLDKDMMLSFVEFLQSKSTGEGAKSIYQRFKKFIKYAIEHDIMIKNPCSGVVCKVDDQTLRKDVLSLEEIERLISTTYDNQNQEIRRAFIFCLYTGIRYCDVIELKYSDVDYSNKLLIFEQAKTKGHSATSGVVTPLNDGLLSLIGENSTNKKDELIFHLPSHTMCLKGLRRWVKRAGIDKHITWHCARHSFAVNILNNGANIKTVASLLGHSGLKHTEKYTRAVDSLKQAAIDSLPELKL
ncbi:site-specific integrase [Bacteroides sp. 224]|uniref:site-specific integrase n=1 Tax=Bacteroides sp. 224 TaxID=2302936 RepID=UPI0013CF59B0|nr:site-specific integrase [Bacteroides sp. 224]NDV63788.1 site-specific integrase [Bacteroides sp. 224]